MVDTTRQESILRELPEIEDYKTGLLSSGKSLVDTANINALSGQYLTPDYEVAGMSPDQLAALQMGRQGIGAYQPFMTAAGSGVTAGSKTLGEAADVLRGADTRGQFAGAQAAMNQAAIPIQQMGRSAQLATAGVPLIGMGAQGIQGAQAMANQYQQANLGQSQGYLGSAANMADQYSQADFGKSQGYLGSAANMADQYSQADFGKSQGYLGSAANMANQYSQANMGQSLATLGKAEQIAAGAGPTDLSQAQSTLGQGIGALQGAAKMYDPSSAQAFMNPYQQQVIDESIRQINRQGDISRQGLQAQATRAGAFGGSREGVQRAELERALSEQRNAAIVGGLSQGYNQASGQAQQAFEQQQARQLSQAQGLQGAAGLQGQFGQAGQQQALQQAQALQGIGGLYGQQSLQQAQLGQGAAGLTSNIGQTIGQQEAQQAQFGQAAAGLKANVGQTLGQQEAQQAQFGQAAAGLKANVGQTLGQQELQQAQIGQGAAGLQGSLSGQLAGLSGLYSNVAGQQANIYGQQSQLGQSLGQGIGNLAGQQFGIGSQIAQGLGSLGTQQANIGMQQAALGQQAQALGQQDTNMLYNLGSSQQKQLQSELDASRQNTLQQNMQPYQQLGFLSDIYKGAPSTQMGVTTQAAPSPSPFQQAAGLGIAGLSAAAAGSRAGIL